MGRGWIKHIIIALLKLEIIVSCNIIYCQSPQILLYLCDIFHFYDTAQYIALISHISMNDFLCYFFTDNIHSLQLYLVHKIMNFYKFYNFISFQWCMEKDYELLIWNHSWWLFSRRMIVLLKLYLVYLRIKCNLKNTYASLVAIIQIFLSNCVLNFSLLKIKLSHLVLRVEMWHDIAIYNWNLQLCFNCKQCHFSFLS